MDTYPSLNPENVRIELEERLPVVIGNEALLTQCFSHLLENAIKFSKPDEKPNVRIWSERAPESLTPPPVAALNPRGSADACLGSNNGVGIPKEAQARIYTMFQRLTDDQRGTGVGLAVVRKIVEQMGGRVDVDSEPGRGSRFWVDLERAAPPKSNPVT